MMADLSPCVARPSGDRSRVAGGPPAPPRAMLVSSHVHLQDFFPFSTGGPQQAGQGVPRTAKLPESSLQQALPPATPMLRGDINGGRRRSPHGVPESGCPEAGPAGACSVRSAPSAALRSHVDAERRVSA